MTSSGDFSLYSYDCFCDGDQWHYQYVFHAESVHPWSSPSLSRVNSVPDLLELLSGDKEATTKFVVGIIALLAGNLIAKGQLAELLSFIVFFLAVGVLQWPLAAKSAAGLLVCYFLSSLHDGVSLEWAELDRNRQVTVFVVMFLAVLAVMLIRMLSKQDPRSYVLLKDSADSRPCSSSSSSSSSIRNACHMDVKVLCFHRDDRVQFIPKGGLWPSNSVVRRNQEIQLKDGDQGPLTVKIFAPFETELGTWSNVQGAYVLRATAPPVTIKPGRPCFRNLSEHNVVVCCSAYDWRCSLWLPLSQLVARLLTPGIVVKSNAEISLTQHLQHLQHVQHEHVAWDPDGRGHGFDQFTAEKDQKDLTGETGESFQSETAPGIPSIPSIPSTKPGDVCRDSDFSRKLVLRVYGGLVGSLGLWGGVLEKACCMVELNEQIDYDGGISWSTPWRNRGPFNSIISSWKSRESNWREQKGF